jgi:C4-dicarboxylate transporter, DctM subunit
VRTTDFPEHSVYYSSMHATYGLLYSIAFTFVPPLVLGWGVAKGLGISGASSLVMVIFTFIWLMIANRISQSEFKMPWLKDEALKVWNTYWQSIWGLLLIVVVIGGIYSGIFTPTEAAAMSAVYAFIVAVFVYKDLKLPKIPKVLLNSASMSAMLLYIITNAMLFSFLMTSEQIPQTFAAWMIDQGLGPIAFLLAVNVLLLLAGNVMEPSSIILIMAPLLFPVAMKLGIDPVHFGILIVVNMEVGMCHPPVGLNLYVASGITKMGITELTVAVWPWLLTMLAFMLLVTYVPAISLWLPKLMGLM